MGVGGGGGRLVWEKTFPVQSEPSGGKVTGLEGKSGCTGTLGWEGQEEVVQLEWLWDSMGEEPSFHAPADVDPVGCVTLSGLVSLLKLLA